VRNTRRIKRMKRNRVKIGKMNLINSGSVEVMEAPKTVKLPESRVETKPRETVVIFVSPDEILVQGQFVGVVGDVLDNDSPTLGAITARLDALTENIVGPNTLAVAGSQEVTILADRSVPFGVVKKIMSTCTQGGYENVSLAVIQKASKVAAAG